ncbi:hypothetical protein OE88DRAFT_1660453 [Heliocybe sulcata]|uniref:Uncharacterized protein n=1 Tax=Heliocybe sulcata TaxID=5364 RepID=A0A5C3N3Z5_9AGAM|nr:hypothetical protein OE88DRAFT_1660453 [Heliocybe sulcata]
MDVLIKRIEDLNFQRPYDRETHKKIYSYINENVLSVADQDECPPLQILIYAVENIISPDLIRLQIPHLLHLLAHIECIRRRAVKQASRALSWNDYFSDSDERRAVLLTEQERKFMEQISDESEQAGDRKLYATVIFRLCQLHIHSLWRDDTEDQLQDYMAQYFPSFTNQQPNRLFYLDLSQDEQRQLRDVGKTCAKFLRDASEWETRLEQAWVAKGYARNSALLHIDSCVKTPDFPLMISTVSKSFCRSAVRNLKKNFQSR